MQNGFAKNATNYVTSSDMQVSFRNSKGTLLHFGKNEGRDTYTLNIETDEGTDSYPMLSEEEIKEINPQWIVDMEKAYFEE